MQASLGIGSQTQAVAGVKEARRTFADKGAAAMEAWEIRCSDLQIHVGHRVRKLCTRSMRSLFRIGLFSMEDHAVQCNVSARENFRLAGFAQSAVDVQRTSMNPS